MFSKMKIRPFTKNLYGDMPNGYQETIEKGMNAVRYFSRICIGEHAIVGAASVVTKDVPDCAVVVGNPAKVVKMLEAGRFS